MKKSDFKNGMKIVMSNSETFIFFSKINYNNRERDILINTNSNSPYGWYFMDDGINDNLKTHDYKRIIEVYIPKHPSDILHDYCGWDLIWQKDKIELLQEEAEEKLGYKVKIVKV